MIKSFRHKGLEKFFNEGITDDIEGADETRLRYALSVIDAADELRDCNASPLNFKKEKSKNLYSVDAGNGKKIIFRLVPQSSEQEK